MLTRQCNASPDSLRAQAAAVVTRPPADEDQARADFYALFAQLMLAPPDAALLHALAHADAITAAGEFALEDAWGKLTQAAGVADAGAVADEFDRLFTSTGAPPLNPNGSFYRTGRLDDAPLAALRHDLAHLGLARGAGTGGSEDHLGAVLETMRMLVAGAPGHARRPPAVQKRFFETHVRPWYAACLADIAGAADANFYRAVAGVLDAFLSIEAQAFAVLDADAHPGNGPAGA